MKMMDFIDIIVGLCILILVAWATKELVMGG